MFVNTSLLKTKGALAGTGRLTYWNLNTNDRMRKGTFTKLWVLCLSSKMCEVNVSIACWYKNYVLLQSFSHSLGFRRVPNNILAQIYLYNNKQVFKSDEWIKARWWILIEAFYGDRHELWYLKASWIPLSNLNILSSNYITGPRQS